MLEVVVRTPLNPSEDADKVKAAVLELFPGAEVTIEAGHLEAKTQTLEPLGRLLRKQKILDAARRTFLKSLDASGTRAVFRLSKQAAVRGRVSFSVETAALGDLVVTVRGEALESLFKRMAPMTLRGIPVSEERAEQEWAKRRSRKAARVTAEAKKKEEDWNEEEEEDLLEAEEAEGPTATEDEE